MGSKFFSRIFGTLKWTPPPWCTSVTNRARAIARAARSCVGSHPRTTVVGSVGLVLLLALAGGAYWWFEVRDKPLRISVNAQAPELTPIETPPRFDALQIRFGAPAARLDRIGKPLGQEVRIEPSISGEWKFDDDQKLVFRPSQDWRVGQEYRVTLERSLFAQKVHLETYLVEFKTKPFSAKFTRAEFYQDPTDPKLKQIVATLSFSHPVSDADLGKHITLRATGEKGSFLGFGSKGFPSTLSFDKLKGEAYVRSEPIPIPEEDTSMTVTLEAGARAAQGGPPTALAISEKVTVPGMFTYFRVEQTHLTLVPNEKFEPEQVLVVETSAGATEEEASKNIAAWLLPKDRPAFEEREAVKNYRWRSTDEVGDDLLSKATKLTLSPIPAGRDDSPVHSFKYQAPVGAYLYVRIAKGMRSFGGYVLAKEDAAIKRVPEYPKEVKIAQPGALLSLSGEKKVSILARDIDGLRFEVARIIPGQVAHLVTQNNGNFSEPQFYTDRFGADDLTERFEEKRPLQRRAPGSAQYSAFDLGEYLGQGKARHGLFLFKVESWDPTLDKGTGAADQRLLLVTDLGMVAKQNADKSHDLFIQSIQSGEPVAGATVQVLGRNGLAVLSVTTDADGHARLPRLEDFKREKAPVAFLARHGEDLSFLPYQRSDRQLELSRFDVGGVVTGDHAGKLDAYLFSDRGLYRPGESFHIAFIARSSNWRTPLAGVPLEAVVTDARGIEIQKERIKLPASGFAEISCQTEETAPTGSWEASVYLVTAKGKRGELLGSTSVRVEEFLPDRMKISTHLSTERLEGWVSPKDLTARVTLQNLFGTPAESRRITAELTLAPAHLAFRAWKEYVFSDPLQAKNRFSEKLEDGKTDAKGEATFSLGLERFEKASYRLTFSAQGYEAEGGRSVTAVTTALVSPLPYLVGYKPDGELRYVSRGSDRSVHLVAIGSDLNGLDVKDLEAELIELRWISVLAKQGDGTFRYESVQREFSRSKKPLAVAAKGTRYALSTAEPGDFAVVIRNAEKTELAKIPFSVAGSGNVTRALEKNAELQVKLAKTDWAAGDSIELQITAPYVGAGLITIERDRVFAWKWFKTTTTRSVQTIKLPAELEGNGYVSVAFVRAIDSQEIFTSPLSYGVAPFSVSRESRTLTVELSSPDVARPGEPFKIRYQASKAGKAVVFAVDEGILQVARYQTPDPLAHFFKKRALEVRTDQILDLILPEFSVVQALSAAGGDAGGDLLTKNLNPFKRKRDKPAVFWSGVVDVGRTPRELTWVIPETFNGTVRVMAVVVSPDAIGATFRKAFVRGHFVITPNAPAFVAPGDTFEVSVGVANNLEGSGKVAKVKLELVASDHLVARDAGARTLEIGQGREASATFKLEAKGKLGSASLRFVASLGDKRTQQTVDLTVRPAVPFQTVLLSGHLGPGKKQEQSIPRRMTPEYRKLEVSASPLPLGLAHGLVDYLQKFPHGCTEQLVSRAFPAIVLRSRPEFGFDPEKVEGNLAAALRVLRARQNSEGAFGMWAANGNVSDFQTVYALHFLTEAKERKYPVPPDLLSRGLEYARGLATGRGHSLPEFRVRAYALYVLTRNGIVTTRDVSALREALDAQKDGAWKKDLTAVHLAATHALLKQEGPAARLLSDARLGTAQQVDYAYFYDGLVYDAQLLYVLARHFPGRLTGLSPDAIGALARPIAEGGFNTLSSAYAILAFDAYAQAAGPSAQQVDAAISEVFADGKARALVLPAGLFPSVAFSGEAAKLRLESQSQLPVFWQATLAGFDAAMPKVEVKDKLEVFREYQAGGKTVSEAKLGGEIEVHLKIRSLGDELFNVAVVDLLPGGFEPVLEDRKPPEPPEASNSDEGDPSRVEGEGEDEDGTPSEDGEAAAEQQRTAPVVPAVGALPVGLETSTWTPEYADVREDRVVLYGTVGREAREFIYRIKATNRGAFTVPPPFAESMYDRGVKARGLSSQIKVSGTGE